MNIKNNKRKQKTQSKIQDVLIYLLQENEINDISVSDICRIAEINRSTFYANYDDVSTLAISICKRIQEKLHSLSIQQNTKNNYVWLFQYVLEKRDFFSVYFKLCTRSSTILLLDNQYTNKEKYRIEFFSCGLHSIIELWLRSGCIETPHEMNDIITEKYNKIFIN